MQITKKKTLKLIEIHWTVHHSGKWIWLLLGPICVGFGLCANSFASDPGSVQVHLCRIKALCDVVCVGCLSFSHHVFCVHLFARPFCVELRLA